MCEQRDKSSPLQFTAVPSTTRTQTNNKCIGYQIQTYDCQAGQAWQEGQGMAEQGKAPSADGASRLPKLPCGAICFVAFGNI